MALQLLAVQPTEPRSLTILVNVCRMGHHLLATKHTVLKAAACAWYEGWVKPDEARSQGTTVLLSAALGDRQEELLYASALLGQPCCRLSNNKLLALNQRRQME